MKAKHLDDNKWLFQEKVVKSLDKCIFNHCPYYLAFRIDTHFQRNL